MTWLWLLACGNPTVEVDVSQAFDVPPPPAHCSLDLGPATFDASIQPGSELRIADVNASVVDRRGDLLTVYLPEPACQRALDQGRVRVGTKR